MAGARLRAPLALDFVASGRAIAQPRLSNATLLNWLPSHAGRMSTSHPSKCHTVLCLPSSSQPCPHHPPLTQAPLEPTAMAPTVEASSIAQLLQRTTLACGIVCMPAAAESSSLVAWAVAAGTVVTVPALPMTIAACAIHARAAERQATTSRPRMARPAHRVPPATTQETSQKALPGPKACWTHVRLSWAQAAHALVVFGDLSLCPAPACWSP